MLKSFLLVGALSLLAASAVATRTPPRPAPPADQAGKPPAPFDTPARRVAGRTLVSDARPAARLKFDKAFKYVGAQSFILYDVARAEQHFFVDADERGRIRRMYWIQFEGYLPSNTHTYDYSGVKEKVSLGGFEFLTDAVAVNMARAPARPDSDGARARAFLEGKGYRMAGDDLMWRRLVHFPDESKRDELMIIYLEDLGGMGLTAADLTGEGGAAARWPEISRQLLKRATKGIKVTRD